jgi:hypothetical protein
MTTKTTSKSGAKTRKSASTKVVVTPETASPMVGEYPSLPKTLEALQFLRTAKTATDAQIAKVLDSSYTECKKNDCVLVIERLMLHIGDVSRQHNILTELGISSKTGGAQERKIFRSCMRWWEKNIPESFAKNLRVFTEFTLYENLMFYQNTTDRKTGKVLSTEILFPMPDVVHEFLATQIRAGKDLNLIAKHLPKVTTGKGRITKKKVKAMKTATEFKLNKIKLPKTEWIKVNGELVTSNDVTVKVGDVISYPRKKQSITLAKQDFINKWISGFCKVMGWNIEQYKKFRSAQNTPEQKFSNRTVLDMPKSDFHKLLDILTAGQRFRVAKMVAYKDAAEKLQPKPKWNQLGEWYIEWEKGQEKVADELRKAAASGDKEKTKELMKDFKVKATGMQTIDILASLFKGGMSDMQINNTYQSLIEKMDLIANVFPIVDGSGSMDSPVATINGVSLSRRQVVYAMCIAFSTRNPVEEFRNTFGWFSNNFYIAGRSKYVDLRPNPYVDKSRYTKQVGDHQVLSPEQTFTQNMKAIAQADPREVANTNMFASVEYFVKLVKDGKCHVEDLPNALLYLTDNENNSGLSPKEAVNLANSIGWHPLLVFWGIVNVPSDMLKEYKNIPNVLLVGGFNESVLSQVLRGIKSGSINPEMELWSIYEDKRYSVLK